MKTTTQITLVLPLLTMLACGNEFNEKGADESQVKGEGESSETVGTEANNKPARTSGGYLEGYIVSAFDLEVDGERYADSEDFYTAQLEKLQLEAEESGYAGYSLRFDAKIGLNDLKYGMRVYIISANEYGFATETTVQENGNFRATIPAKAYYDTYKIRTNKRVSVTLTSPDKKDVQKWCYNFSGHETQTTIENPALIKVFTTNVTKYACSQSTSSGIEIPVKNTKSNLDETDVTSKEEVLRDAE